METSFDTQIQFLEYNLLNNSKIFYTPLDFDLENFVQKIAYWLENEQERKTKIDEINNIKIINYQLRGGLKNTLGLAGKFQLFLLIKDNKLIYEIKPTKWLNDWNKKESSFDFKKFVQNSIEAEITEWTANYLINQYFSDKKDFIISENNRYIENIDKKEKLWFYDNQKEGEILLAFLNIDSVKQISGVETPNNELKWKYLLTNKNSKIVGFNSKIEEVESFDISDKQMIINKGLTKDTVEVGSYQWVTTMGNAKFYREIYKYVDFEANQKLYEIAKQNWLYSNKEAYSFVSNLLGELVDLRNNPFDELSLFFIEYLHEDKNTVFENLTKDEKLSKLITKVVNYEDVEDQLLTWKDDWKLSTNQEITILRLILEFAENDTQLLKILQFHSSIRDKFLKLEKDNLNIIIFEIEYCKHLIECNQKTEATKILTKRLKELPDETLSDLLPSEDIDPTSNASGQLLKVSLLELLAKSEDVEKSVSRLLEITMLQPLSKNRLDNLASVATNDLKQKTQIIRDLLEPEAIGTADSTFEDVKYQKLNKKEIEQKLKHPATRKGGMFGSLQNWIANVKIPDYTVIKSYSEPLTSRKYPEISNIITDIKVAFGLDGIETYISHGDKSVGIMSFEGTPSFLIVGSEHLDEESPYFLNFSELEFVIGLELAHLYFNHSRITSSDVWRGAMEKGSLVLDTLLSVIPFVGSVGNAIKHIPKLSLLAEFTQNSSKISQIGSKSLKVLEKTSLAVNLLDKIKSSDDKTEKKQELIAIARMLQLTADRSGLLFTGDLKSAIRTIFLTSKTYAQEFDVANRYGINEYLLSKDSEGNYKNQELAIRFASLFSFYLSDDYDELRKILIKTK